MNLFRISSRYNIRRGEFGLDVAQRNQAWLFSARDFGLYSRTGGDKRLTSLAKWQTKNKEKKKR